MPFPYEATVPLPRGYLSAGSMLDGVRISRHDFQAAVVPTRINRKERHEDEQPVKLYVDWRRIGADRRFDDDVRRQVGQGPRIPANVDAEDES